MKYRILNRTAAATAVATGMCLSLTGCLEGAPTLELPGYVEADITAVATPVAGDANNPLSVVTRIELVAGGK